MNSVGDAYDNAMCESFFATLKCELLDRHRFKTQAEARSAVFSFIEGFYNPRRRHSSIGYLAPIVVLAAVKDKACGRPREAVLDRHCARPPHHSAARDERMAPPDAEPKNATKQEDKMPPNQLA
jgi:Integrase core domain